MAGNYTANRVRLTCTLRARLAIETATCFDTTKTVLGSLSKLGDKCLRLTVEPDQGQGAIKPMAVDQRLVDLKMVVIHEVAISSDRPLSLTSPFRKTLRCSVQALRPISPFSF